MRSDRLRTVLRLRKLREQQALGDVAVAQEQLSEARRALEQRRLDRQIDPAVEEQEAIRLRAMQLAGMRAVELTDQARADIHRCVTELEEALQSWRVASARTKSVERLDERRQLEASVAAMKSSQRSLDELVLLLRGREVGS